MFGCYGWGPGGIATHSDMWALHFDEIWGQSVFGAADLGPHGTLNFPGQMGFMDTMVSYLVPPEILRVSELKSTTNVAELASQMFDPFRSNFKWRLGVDCGVCYNLSDTEIMHVYKVVLEGEEISDDDFCRLIRGMGGKTFRKSAWTRIKIMFGMGGDVDVSSALDKHGPGTRLYSVSPDTMA